MKSSPDWKDRIAIVDGTLIPTRDHRLAAQSKNYRYSTILQVTIDANTRLIIALDDPQPGNPATRQPGNPATRQPGNPATIVYRRSGINQQLAGL